MPVYPVIHRNLAINCMIFVPSVEVGHRQKCLLPDSPGPTEPLSKWIDDKGRAWWEVVFSPAPRIFALYTAIQQANEELKESKDK